MTLTTFLLLLVCHWAAGTVSQGLLPTGIIFPLDIFPTGPNCAAWIPIINSIHNQTHIPFFIAINPDSGPGGGVGSQPDESHQTCIPQLRAPNVKLLGYVTTLGGNKSLSNVQLEIATYAQWNALYRPDGIYLDQAAISSSLLPLYRNYTAAVRSSFQAGPIVLDPGDYPQDAGYFEIADMIIVYVGAYNSFQSSTLTINSQIPASKQAVIVTSTPSQLPTQFLQDVANVQKIGAVFASNLSEDNAFIEIPPYWTTFVDSLSGLQTETISSTNNSSMTSGSTSATRTMSSSITSESSTFTPVVSGKSRKHAGAIAGGVIGSLVFFGLIGFSVFLLRRSYNNTHGHSGEDNISPFHSSAQIIHPQMQSHDITSRQKHPIPIPGPSTSSVPHALPASLTSTGNMATIATSNFSSFPSIRSFERPSRYSEDPYLSSDLELTMPGSAIQHQDSGMRLHSQGGRGVRELPPLYSEE
ncbi:hypothetical protein M422DRAFT_219032 [Sphaerobolus stellatus SS14]|nr:hypothetical protein M422DRAFT_219032 [Sphaerobolus stellatus SS14]